MKKNTEVKNNCYVCTQGHKILAWAVLVGIFLCGMMTGVSLWGYKHVYAPESGVYKVSDNLKNKQTCEEIEEKLLGYISDDDYAQNLKIYNVLSVRGCEENRAYFTDMAVREHMLLNTMDEVFNETVTERPCQVIERQLSAQLSMGDSVNSWLHSRNAKIYSQMAEDGCAENAKKYKQLALNELQIAEGIRVDENDIDQSEMLTTVNTYKKLQMQNEAKKYIKKVEKLVDPGIDFIMELQRVIEE